MCDESTSEQTGRLSEEELAQLDGIVRDEDGRLRARLEVSANAGRVPKEYE